MHGLWRTLGLQKTENWKKYAFSMLNLEFLVFSVQAFKEITQILPKFAWLPGKNIIDIQSFSSQLYEIIIDYLFNAPKLTSACLDAYLTNKRFWLMRSFIWRSSCLAWCAAYNCSNSSKNSRKKHSKLFRKVSSPEKHE